MPFFQFCDPNGDGLIIRYFGSGWKLFVLGCSILDVLWSAEILINIVVVIVRGCSVIFTGGIIRFGVRWTSFFASSFCPCISRYFSSILIFYPFPLVSSPKYSSYFPSSSPSACPAPPTSPWVWPVRQSPPWPLEFLWPAWADNHQFVRFSSV